MKRILIFGLMILTACSNEPFSSIESVGSYEYTNVSNLEVDAVNMFSVNKAFYYVYFYSPYCSHCNAIKNTVIEYAIVHHEMLWFITPNSGNDFKGSPDLSVNIGAKDVKDVYLNGYPTLMKLHNQEISGVYQGKSQIIEELKAKNN